MKQTLIAAGLTLGLVVPLAAQTATDTPPPAPPAEASPPPAKAEPAPEAQQPSVVDRQRNGAAKLAGLVRFVDGSCPDLKPDYEVFKKVIAAMNVDIKDLENGPLMATSLGYSRAYDSTKEESCRRAVEMFGENGKAIPGVIGKRTP